MNEMRVFESAEFGRIRTAMRDGEPWFVAADVCRALGLEQVSRAMDRLDEDERGVLTVTHPQSPGKMMEVNGVSEPGLYHLALCSTKPEAKAFKRWITHEVVPSIRKHGAYASDEVIDRILGDPDFGIRLLGELKEERARRRELEAQTLEDAPRVRFAQSVEASAQTILIGELAKLMRQNGVEVGQNRLFQRLREDGLLCERGERRNAPTQRAMEMGLFQVVERTVESPDGSVRLTRTTKVTGKGQVYLINKYRGVET